MSQVAEIEQRAEQLLGRLDGVEVEIGSAELSAMLVGPIVYHTTMQKGLVSDELIDRLIDGVGTWHG